MFEKKNKTAITLFNNETDTLFSIGKDIYIMKEHKKSECYCIPKSFKYPKKKVNILTGRKGIENKFEIERIIVIQME